MLQFIQNLRTKFEGTAIAADIDALEAAFVGYKTDIDDFIKLNYNATKADIAKIRQEYLDFKEWATKRIVEFQEILMDKTKLPEIESLLPISGNSHASLPLTEAGDSETGHEAVASQNQEAANSTLP